MSSRIVVTVRGGIAEITDAQNWPDGLELYVVDYDAAECDWSEDMSYIDGECEISCYADFTGKRGIVAEKVAKEYLRSTT
ncbi:hypothetical protein [Hoeflea sp.]|uniref:hypothetical protein n=1 Tax=Hoeflea sp. TaxID=1940281 RepID=UPI003A91E0B9